MVTSFTLYRSAYPSQTPTVVSTFVPPNGNYVDAAVTPDKAYSYWVDAHGTGGTSGLPTPQAMIPLQPPVLAITPFAGRNLLVWSPATVTPNGAVTGYVVYRAPLPTPSTTPVFIPISPVLEGISDATFADTSLTEGSTYIYKVASSQSNSSYSPPNATSHFSLPVSLMIFPRAVDDFNAIAGDQLVQLQWTYQGSLSFTYFIQRKLGSADDSAFQTIKSGIVGNNFLDTGVKDKTFYTYRIYTVDGGGTTSTGFASADALPGKGPVISDPKVSISQDSAVSQVAVGNTLTWQGADQQGIDPTTMYPLGGYNLFQFTGWGSRLYLGDPDTGDLCGRHRRKPR